MVFVQVREKLSSNCFVALLGLGAPRSDEDHRTFRTETAKMTLFLDAPQGRLRHGGFQSYQFEVHIECCKRAPLRGAHLSPASYLSTLNECLVGKSRAKRRNARGQS